MAILRMRDLQEMDAKSMSAKLAELKRELSIERSSAAGVGRTANSGKIRALKRTIARVLTVARIKGIKLEPVATPKAEAKPAAKAEPKAKEAAKPRTEVKPAVKAEAKSAVKTESKNVSPKFSEIIGEVKKEQ
ncbi:50S ribosomal protein L29 [Candidatus Burarchaeum australiense]|nr:50S ribosomal protein L29 [Candidatus Burarchaeum australiense]